MVPGERPKLVHDGDDNGGGWRARNLSSLPTRLLFLTEDYRMANLSYPTFDGRQVFRGGVPLPRVSARAHLASSISKCHPLQEFTTFPSIHFPGARGSGEYGQYGCSVPGVSLAQGNVQRVPPCFPPDLMIPDAMHTFCRASWISEARGAL